MANEAVEKKKDKSKEADSRGGSHWPGPHSCNFQQHRYFDDETTGQVVAWASTGKMGFKGSKKNTPYAAQTAAQECATKALNSVCVKWKYL